MFFWRYNVQDHRRRTAGATDAGEERALASVVTAGRCSVDRLVGKLLFEQVTVGAAPFKIERIFILPVDEQPVWLNMTISRSST